MVQNKWLKIGAAAFLSVGMLAGCGNEQENNDDMDTEEMLPGEEDTDNVDRQTDTDEEEENPGDESNQDADNDAETDSDAEENDDIDTDGS